MNKKMLILFISIVLAMPGYGMAFTVLPFFIEELGGSGAQFGILLILFGFMQLIFAPAWIKVSDKYGRKPVLILGMIGLGSFMLFFGLASAIWMLYVAQVASGILSSAMPSVAMAYISDSSSPETRSGAMVDININLPYLGGALFFVIMFLISLKQKNQLIAVQTSCQPVEQQSRRLDTNI